MSDLGWAEAEHLAALCSCWQVLADLSFADLLLHVRVSGGESFEVCAQQRPFTAQTLYPQDMVGSRLSPAEQPIVERAFREGRVWEQADPVLVNGVPLRMRAIPVRFRDDVVAIVTKEGSPATSRRPGRLEQVYLDVSEQVSAMICDGTFPHPERPVGEWPRVGDGLVVLDAGGRVRWASPNASSCFRRLGVRPDVEGSSLGDLGLDETPVERALDRRGVADGELARADTHVRLRIMALLRRGAVTGALCLMRDVTEVRAKERMISVKDAAIRETHHRVKNNLQTIASLLRLQARRLGSEEARSALGESVVRIRSIAMVHEILSEEPSDAVDFTEVARRIAAMVRDGLLDPESRVTISVAGHAGRLEASLATPLAVALTELMQNAVEHAFPDGRAGHVEVVIARSAGGVTLRVRDDGAGIEGDAPGRARLGLHIVRSLVDELGGSFNIAADAGTRAEISIPRGSRERVPSSASQLSE